MSSFRNHRVIIASLFLPSTAVFGESAPPTPDPPSHDADIDIQRLNANLAAAPKRQPAPALSAISAAHTRQNSASGLPPPLKSIVDDLKDKVSNTPPQSSHSPSYSVLRADIQPLPFALRQQKLLTPFLNSPASPLSLITTSPKSNYRQPVHQNIPLVSSADSPAHLPAQTTKLIQLIPCPRPPLLIFQITGTSRRTLSAMVDSRMQSIPSAIVSSASSGSAPSFLQAQMILMSPLKRASTTVCSATGAAYPSGFLKRSFQAVTMLFAIR